MFYNFHSFGREFRSIALPYIPKIVRCIYYNIVDFFCKWDFCSFSKIFLFFFKKLLTNLFCCDILLSRQNLNKEQDKNEKTFY